MHCMGEIVSRDATAFAVVSRSRNRFAGQGAASSIAPADLRGCSPGSPAPQLSSWPLRLRKLDIFLLDFDRAVG